MFNFAEASKSALVDMVRGLQEERGEPINAFSTLQRLKNDALVDLINAKLDGVFDITDDGVIVRIANGADEPTELDAQVDEDLGVADPVVPPAQPEVVVDEKKARASSTNREGVIVILKPFSPVREGSGGAHRRSLITNGMPVARFYEKVGNDAQARRTLRYLRREGSIRIDPSK